MYAHALALLPYGTAVFVEERIVLNGSQHHVDRKTGCVGQTHGEPPFSVESDHQGNFG